MRTAVSAALVAAAIVLGGTPAEAAAIRVLASNGVKAAIEALEPQLEKAAGSMLSIERSTAPTLRERLEKGAPFELATLPADAREALAKAGKLSPMRTRLARVGIGVGFRAGTPKPDVSTADAIKRSLLAAKAIAYTGNGASRPAIDRMFGKLGIARQIEAKSHLTPAGAAPASVRRGESDLVLTLISEILPEPGVQLAGPLPAEFQTYLGFSAAPSSKAAGDPKLAALVRSLDGRDAAAVYVAKGMEAAR